MLTIGLDAIQANPSNLIMVEADQSGELNYNMLIGSRLLKALLIRKHPPGCQLPGYGRRRCLRWSELHSCHSSANPIDVFSSQARVTDGSTVAYELSATGVSTAIVGEGLTALPPNILGALGPLVSNAYAFSTAVQSLAPSTVTALPGFIGENSTANGTMSMDMSMSMSMTMPTAAPSSSSA